MLVIVSGLITRVSHLAERVEDMVEVQEDLALCNLCDVVHALAGIVPDAGIVVGEASQHWRHNFMEVAGNFL